MQYCMTAKAQREEEYFHEISYQNYQAPKLLLHLERLTLNHLEL